MENINTLKQSLEQQKISLSRYGIDLLCRLILALIQTRCVNLKKVAAALYGPAQVDSHYRRLQRFFAQQISPEIFATLILARIAQEGQHLYLTLDRTHWKLGKTHQNIFCLGILFQGVSIPFMYEVLGKAGNSNTDEGYQLISTGVRPPSSSDQQQPTSIHGFSILLPFIGVVYLDPGVRTKPSAYWYRRLPR